ncbi:MAG: hypothetical protein ACRERV_15585, partial [Methylococcales bacterium]
TYTEEIIMKTLINFQLPVESFNTLVREGTAGDVLSSILEEIKPEVVYFYAPNGCRRGTMVVNLDDPPRIPSIAEPFFLKFGAKCEFHIAMSPDDLTRAGLDELGKRWG